MTIQYLKILLPCLVPGVLTLALFGGSARAADADTKIEHVDAAGAAKLVTDKKVVVLDIRTPKEYQAGHIAGAKNLDFYERDFAQKLATLDKATPYLVHCAAGGRSTKSLDQFKKLGFKSVVHLDGGFKAWEKAGQPVEK
jgi:rhodanese-related sulfurtransferase